MFSRSQYLSAVLTTAQTSGHSLEEMQEVFGGEPSPDKLTEEAGDPDRK